MAINEENRHGISSKPGEKQRQQQRNQIAVAKWRSIIIMA